MKVYLFFIGLLAFLAVSCSYEMADESYFPQDNHFASQQQILVNEAILARTARNTAGLNAFVERHIANTFDVIGNPAQYLLGVDIHGHDTTSSPEYARSLYNDGSSLEQWVYQQTESTLFSGSYEISAKLKDNSQYWEISFDNFMVRQKNSQTTDTVGNTSTGIEFDSLYFVLNGYQTIEFEDNNRAAKGVSAVNPLEFVFRENTIYRALGYTYVCFSVIKRKFIKTELNELSGELVMVRKASPTQPALTFRWTIMEPLLWNFSDTSRKHPIQGAELLQIEGGYTCLVQYGTKEAILASTPEINRMQLDTIVFVP